MKSLLIVRSRSYSRAIFPYTSTNHSVSHCISDKIDVCGFFDSYRYFTCDFQMIVYINYSTDADRKRIICDSL